MQRVAPSHWTVKGRPHRYSQIFVAEEIRLYYISNTNEIILGQHMALKSITLRLDEEEYEKLKAYLSEFGDPDINVAYVLRAYIRDLNRALPFLLQSGWDLKTYFGLLGAWLKQFGSVTEVDLFAKMMLNPWAFWNRAERGGDSSSSSHQDANESSPHIQKSGDDSKGGI